MEDVDPAPRQELQPVDDKRPEEAQTFQETAEESHDEKEAVSEENETARESGKDDDDDKVEKEEGEESEDELPAVSVETTDTREQDSDTEKDVTQVEDDAVETTRTEIVLSSVDTTEAETLKMETTSGETETTSGETETTSVETETAVRVETTAASEGFVPLKDEKDEKQMKEMIPRMVLDDEKQLKEEEEIQTSEALTSPERQRIEIPADEKKDDGLNNSTMDKMVVDEETRDDKSQSIDTPTQQNANHPMQLPFASSKFVAPSPTPIRPLDGDPRAMKQLQEGDISSTNSAPTNVNNASFVNGQNDAAGANNIATSSNAVSQSQMFYHQTNAPSFYTTPQDGPPVGPAMTEQGQSNASAASNPINSNTQNSSNWNSQATQGLPPAKISPARPNVRKMC